MTRCGVNKRRARFSLLIPIDGSWDSQRPAETKLWTTIAVSLQGHRIGNTNISPSIVHAVAAAPSSVGQCFLLRPLIQVNLWLIK